MASKKRQSAAKSGNPLPLRQGKSSKAIRLVKSKEVALRLGCSKRSLYDKMAKLQEMGLKRVSVGRKGKASMFDADSLDDLMFRVAYGQAVLP